MLKYHLVNIFLPGHTDKYRAQIRAVGSCDKDAFIKRIVSKGSSITETDAIAVLNAIENTAVELLQEGYTLNLPLFNTSFSISGVFDGPVDSFDSQRHKLNVNFIKGALLQDLEETIPLKKTRTPVSGPKIHEIKDSVSGKINSRLTPGGIIEIRGNNIKISGEDSECGLWFVHETQPPVKAEVIATNKPSVVLAMIPELTSGTYNIRIVTRYSGTRDFQNPKTCIHPADLIVC